MSISCRREPDPFNLPPRGWACYGVEKISSDEKDRVRILAENGDGCAMVRYAAVCMEDGGVEWFKRAALWGACCFSDVGLLDLCIRIVHNDVTRLNKRTYGLLVGSDAG